MQYKNAKKKICVERFVDDEKILNVDYFRL